MGNFVCKRLPEHRILFIGLDAAGKTSILYKMCLGEVVTTIPTIGFNVETVSLNNSQITCWDIGCRDKSRALMRHYFQNTQGLIFVIDSSDRERLDIAFDIFEHCLKEDELSGTVVMMLANKQDLKGAMTCEELEVKWKDKKITSNHKLFFRPCSVTTGVGLVEAFEELSSQMIENEEKKQEIALDGAEHQREISFNLLMNRPVGFIKSLLLY